MAKRIAERSRPAGRPSAFWAAGSIATIRDLALEEGREVFTVPGEITATLSAGTNALLKVGASPLTSAADVLSFFGVEAAARYAGIEGAAAELLQLVREQPSGADELARRAGLEAGEVARTLVELELAGLVTVSDGLYRAAVS